MTTPIKAPKTPKNQPITFRETIAPASAYVPAPAVARPTVRLTDRQQRLALTLIWAAVMVLAGVAVGWRIVASQQAAVSPPGAPVAAGTIKVAPLSIASVTTTPTVATVQPAAAPDALTPGFQSEVTAQGNIGTAAVR